jgi:hypothetical protein
MTKTFHLANDLKLPEEAVTQTFALLARRGAGKTHTGSVLAEEMLAAGYPIVVIDPTDAWWGLKSKYSIAVLGGPHADLPLEPTGGKVIAGLVVNERVPVILSLKGFGENEMRRFVGDFAAEFYRIAKGDPVHWFIDEADEFAPQRDLSGPAAKSLGALQNIVRRGRLSGIGVTLITQRSAVINKDLLTQTEVLIAMQTTAPQDLAAIEAWLKYHSAKDERDLILRELPKFQRGEAWVYSPGWLGILKRVTFRKRHSFDSSATPKPGEHRAAPKRLADIDLAALQKQLADTIERVKADDPAELRKRIHELERQLKAKAAGQADPAAIETAQARGFERGVASAEQKHRAAEKKYTALVKRCEEAIAASLRLQAAIAELGETKTAPSTALEESARTAAKSARRETLSNAGFARPLEEIRKAPVNSSNGQGLSKAGAAILRACYWLRHETPSKAKVAFYANYSANSSSFHNALGSLRSAGMLEGLSITELGIAAIGNVAEKPHGAELREWLRAKLGAAENKILDALIDRYPQRLTKAQIAEGSGYSDNSSSFHNALGTLRTIEAAEGYEREGGTAASAVFFE